MKAKIYLNILTLSSVLLCDNIAHSQTYQPSNRSPVADNTLGTQVSGSNSNFTVTGGLSRGQNLFHSFTDFSVPNNRSVTFINPVGNQSIITRVTGNLFSDINGKVDTNGANFFLINPNGIVFGNNAQLNVGKAFVGSTGNAINLVDAQGRVYTFGTKNINDTPLLTVNPNVFLNISSLNMGASSPSDVGIKNYGLLQTNNDSQYIGLIGGNVTLDGRDGGGKIIAPGGRVDLGGLNTAGMVSIDNLGLVYTGNKLIRSDISLINGAVVDVRANQTLETINTFFNKTISTGSTINISANNLQSFNNLATNNQFTSFLKAGLNQNSGLKVGSGGDININATGKVSLTQGSIFNTIESGANGKIGNINITAKELEIKNGNAIVSSTSGKGNAGDINIKIIGNILVSGSDIFDPAIDRNIYTGSRIATDTMGEGNTGKISIDTQGKLSLLNRGYISSQVVSGSTGNSQGINITAREIDISNASNIGSDTTGKGNAGNINIKTTGDLTIVGCELFSSLCPVTQITYNLLSISSSTFASGDAGKISIDTQGKLSLSNQGYISSEVRWSGTGNSQGIDISARELNLNNKSYIETSTFGKGNAGNIDIKVKDAINLSNDSLIQSSTRSDVSRQNRAGDISVSSNQLNLKNGGIFSDSNTLKGGNITLTIKDRLLMQPDSGISTDSTGNQTNGDGGNITISSPLIIATPGDSYITANASAGSGGRVNITSQGLFGIQFRPKGQDSPLTNDITASSTFGQNGTVNISTPGIDPGKDANQLPTVPTDASNQISQTCSPSNRDSKFAVTGRGGLPKNAYDLLSSDVVWKDPRVVNQPIASNTGNQPTKKFSSPAIGWVFDGKGKVTLIAAESQGQPTGTRVVCPNGEK
jgi:filamentous hemagglutinin family protein